MYVDTTVNPNNYLGCPQMSTVTKHCHAGELEQWWAVAPFSRDHLSLKTTVPLRDKCAVYASNFSNSCWSGQYLVDIAVRLTARTPHVTPVLKHLQWVQRINYKIFVLTFKSSHHLVPTLAVRPMQPDHSGRQLRSSVQTQDLSCVHSKRHVLSRFAVCSSASLDGSA